MSDKHTFLKATTLVAAITSLSRVMGLIRDMVAGALLGAGRVSDVFWIAFELPNLARRALGEGALSAFIVPLFSAEKRERGAQAAWRFASNALNAMALLGAVLTLLGMVFSRQVFMLFGGLGISLRNASASAGLSEAQAVELGVQLTRLMFPYLMFLTISSVLMGLCHALRRFAAPAFGSVVMNLSMIAAGALFFLVDRQREITPAEQIRFAWWLSWAVLLGIGLRVLVHLPVLFREGFRPRRVLDLRDNRLLELFRKLPLACVGLLMAQVMISVNKFFAMFMGDGYVTQLNYASRITQLPLGILASAMATTILPQLTHYLHEREDERLHELFGFAMRAILILFIPATVGLIMLREPLLALLFERLNWTAEDTAGASWALLFYALGLAPMAALQLILPLYYARLNLRQPVIASVIALLLNIVLNALFLFSPMRQGGLALATSISILVNVLLLVVWQEGRLAAMKMWRLGETLIKCLGASAIMAGGILALRFGVATVADDPTSFAARAAFIAGAVPLGIALYLTSAAIFKVRDLSDVFSLLKTRRAKSTQ